MWVHILVWKRSTTSERTHDKTAEKHHLHSVYAVCWSQRSTSVIHLMSLSYPNHTKAPRLQVTVMQTLQTQLSKHWIHAQDYISWTKLGPCSTTPPPDKQCLTITNNILINTFTSLRTLIAGCYSNTEKPSNSNWQYERLDRIAVLCVCVGCQLIILRQSPFSSQSTVVKHTHTHTKINK